MQKIDTIYYNAGDQLKEEGTARVIDNEQPQLVAILDRAIRELAATGQPFTVEDARNRAGEEALSMLRQPNTVGAAFNRVKSEGLIRAVGYTKARRPSRHSAVIRQWVGAEHAG